MRGRGSSMAPTIATKSLSRRNVSPKGDTRRWSCCEPNPSSAFRRRRRGRRAAASAAFGFKTPDAIRVKGENPCAQRADEPAVHLRVPGPPARSVPRPRTSRREVGRWHRTTRSTSCTRIPPTPGHSGTRSTRPSSPHARSSGESGTRTSIPSWRRRIGTDGNRTRPIGRRSSTDPPASGRAGSAFDLRTPGADHPRPGE